jgi:hypothetical protein
VRRTAVIILGLLAVAATVVGCSKPESSISLYSHGRTISVDPTAYCDVQLTKCYGTQRPVTTVRVPPGSPLQISVPTEVAAAPWAVTFDYLDANGKKQEVRGPVFPTSTQFAYTVRPPQPTDQLTWVEIVVFGGIAMAPDDTAPTYLASEFWTVNATK